MGEKTLISCIDYTYLTHAFIPPPSRKPVSEGRDQGDMDAQGQKGEAGAGSREVRTPFRWKREGWRSWERKPSPLCLRKWLPKEQESPRQVTGPWTLVGEAKSRLGRMVAEGVSREQWEAAYA